MRHGDVGEGEGEGHLQVLAPEHVARAFVRRQLLRLRPDSAVVVRPRWPVAAHDAIVVADALDEEEPARRELSLARSRELGSIES